MLKNIIIYIAFSVGIVSFIEINRRYLLLSFLSGLLILLHFSYFAQIETWTLFLRFKIYSVFVPIVFFALFQLCHSKRNRYSIAFARIGKEYIIPLVLVLNIAEAMLTDFFYGHYFNGFIGLVLIATMPIIGHGWFYDKENILGFTQHPAWPLLYTLWNITFVLTNPVVSMASTSMLDCVLILVLALAYAIIHKSWHLWFIARAYSLDAVLFIAYCLPDLLPPTPFSSLNYMSSILLYGLSTIGVIYLIYEIVCYGSVLPKKVSIDNKIEPFLTRMNWRRSISKRS